MDRDTWLKYYEASPGIVQEYLLSRKSADNEGAAQAKLAYDNDAWDRVMDAVWETVFGQASRQDFQGRIKQVAGDRKPEDVEKEVLFHIVLPLADLVSWDVEGRLQELGLTLSEIQSAWRISLRPVSFGAAVRRIAALAKLSILGEEMFRRLRELLVSYLKGVRTIEQMKEVLQRGQSDGGLGFTKDQAELYIKTLVEFLASTKVMSEEEFAEWFRRFQDEAQSKPVITADTAREATDQSEISSNVATMPKGGTSGTSLEAALETLPAKAALPNLDEYLTKRLMNIASTRLRDVRNDLETQAVLQRDVKVGGMGLDVATAQRVSLEIERIYNEYRGKISEEEKARIASILEKQKVKVEERKKRESEEHAKWFQEKVKTARQEDASTQQFMEAMQKMAQSKATVGDQTKTVRVTTVQIPATPAGPSSTRELPQAAPAEISMADVKAPTKLTGLIEELGGMTWAEFRRMAKTPDQSSEKIRQKLETLKQESFDRWTAGVQAWRNSPLQRLYLQLVAESFGAGKPVAQLVEEKRAADPSLPSAEEIGAVISLNNQIHF